MLANVGVDIGGQRTGRHVRRDRSAQRILAVDQYVVDRLVGKRANTAAGDGALDHEPLQSQRLAGRIFDRHRHLVIFFHTGLDRPALGRTIQQLDAVEIGGTRNVVDLGNQLIHLLLQRHAVLAGHAAGGCLHGQFAHPLKHVRYFAQRAFGRLHH